MASVRAYRTIRYAKRGAVAVVTLDRPHVLNAYDMAMRDDLFAVFGAADQDPDVRALVLQGSGPAFSTGGDLREFGSAPSAVVAREVRWWRDVWGRLLSVRAVTIAAVHGFVVGGGFEMAMLCDLCVAARDARFALPETALGMIPGVGGTQTLPRRVGLARAHEVVMLGRWLDASTAAAWGVVNVVVPRARLTSTAQAWARRAASRDPLAARAVRRLVRAAQDGTFAEGCALERRLGLGLQPAR